MKGFIRAEGEVGRGEVGGEAGCETGRGKCEDGRGGSEQRGPWRGRA